MAPKFRFVDGEKVLCFHGPLLYEAKCMKSQTKEKTVKYFIHYSGWNKNWDEWVPESRVLKFNEANLQKQKELQTAHGSSLRQAKKTKPMKGGSKKEVTDREASALPTHERTPKQKAVPPPPPPVESPAEQQRKKRATRAEQNVEMEEEYIQKLEVKVRIPDELKHWLVDDWDLVNRQNKLVQLPVRLTVDNIIADYVKQKLSVKGITPNKETAIIEATNGIKEYFNVMLATQLLYKFERQQHKEVACANPDLTTAQIYGAIHLLRLFTKLGGALAYTPLEEDSLNLLSIHLHDFVKYLSKSAALFFCQGDYITATPEYIKKANLS